MALLQKGKGAFASVSFGDHTSMNCPKYGSASPDTDRYLPVAPLLTHDVSPAPVKLHS